MPRVEFEHLPEHARLWVFAADRALTPTERDRLLVEVDGFLDRWTAHGIALTAARQWRYERFLFLGVDERAAGVSGCSIDSLMRDLKVLEAELGVTLLDHAAVLFRRGDSIERVSRDGFAELVRAGAVTLETPVYDNTVASVGDLKAGRWEGPAANAWHARAFF